MNLLRCLRQQTCRTLEIGKGAGIDCDPGLLAGFDNSVLAGMPQTFVKQAELDLLGDGAASDSSKIEGGLLIPEDECGDV
ncbi:hypothetical protein E4U51_005434 [Claviceps purpurea]|nr:hypothetical protein E4U51_005434 [Claviceps purpurea]